ncbi:MAG: aromatic amino acid hydroxylase [Polyangiaceae bacterium]|nr:aromatic amino acid hydroxylase [Polyangiaceae bacterium]
MSPLQNVPPHLRRWVVTQDMSRYGEIDHAVWRFVAHQTYAVLEHSAHPAYRAGLSKTGISLDQIPSISEMNGALAEFGWGAVAVDGFIAPRAFQEFQASRLLPIATEIRSAEHVGYTPAPDIIHEAAGHAPILSDPEYAQFIERFGQLGRRAFRLPQDEAYADAVAALSCVREDAGSTDAEVSLAEARVEEAAAARTRLSEAARLSRLYWWTAEYGLVGRTDEYKIYGAGLLSSLGECHSCHAPAVTKRELSLECWHVPYDITRPQPQLYVAQDFAQLSAILAEAYGQLAYQQGELTALLAAVNSGEVCDIELSGGAHLAGNISEGAGTAEGTWLCWDRCVIWDGQGWSEHDAYQVAFGQLATGKPAISAGAGCPGERLELQYKNGARVRGRRARHDSPSGCLRLTDATVTAPDGTSRQHWELLWPLARCIVTASPGWPKNMNRRPTAYPERVVPKLRVVGPSNLRLNTLFREAHLAWEARRSEDCRVTFERIHRELRRDFPDEWLLRMNLLECWAKLGRHEHAAPLAYELKQLEVRHEFQQPIYTGLRYLARRYQLFVSLSESTQCA